MKINKENANEKENESNIKIKNKMSVIVQSDDENSYKNR